MIKKFQQPMKNNKGQSLLAVLLTAGGIFLSFVAGTYAVISTRFASVNNNIVNHEGRISSVEAKIERIPIIESKIDKLLEERKIKYEYATTTAK